MLAARMVGERLKRYQAAWPPAPLMADKKYEDLAAFLNTLGNANRLLLLRQMRQPRRVSDLRINPEDPREGENPERAVTRQAVRHHLQKLIGSNVVQLHSRGQGYVGNEYLVNRGQLFAITEELRELVRLEASEAPLQSETQISIPLKRPPAAKTRSIVLVHGIDEGRAWSMPESGSMGIGRARTSDVRLDYDPFVSTNHARLEVVGGRTDVMDLGSRNGTFVNWVRLAKNDRRPLAPGDVVGIGRSSLVYRG